MICSRRSFVLQAISAGTLDSPGIRLTAAQEPDIDQTGAARGPARVSIVDTALPQLGPPIRSGDFSMVGQYDVDWLLEPPMQRLLDNMAASPSAFASVRFFHALDSGTRADTIDDDPLDGGRVWPSSDAAPDFTRTFAALETLTRRGLVPFIGLNFFPKAVSANAATPPRDFSGWKALIRGFLDALATDPRFGSAIADWYFEVWNEPNGRPFWRGAYNPDYFHLYHATSEAVREVGHSVRLGGPAIVYRAGSDESRRDMEQFLRFVSDDANIKCDFISLHAKGSWSSEQNPDFETSVAAAIETAQTALAIDAGRFSGLPIINNEADMRVGFNIPYFARMDRHFAAWLCCLMIAYDQLNDRFRRVGFRFMAASDNANQQLVRAAFDGRRSIMTRASSSARDLIKLPVFNFYEILRLLGERHGSVISGSESLYPNSQVFHFISVARSHIAIVFSVHPRARSEPPRSWAIEYTVADIPWPKVNIAEFRIGAAHSNAFAAAGRDRTLPYPLAPELRGIRHAQEFTVASPIDRGVLLADNKFSWFLALGPWDVVVLWITPVVPERPRQPEWLETTVEDGNVILRWTPNHEPFFYSYELYLLTDDAPRLLVSPVPLRSAMWVDTAPPTGRRTYAVRAVTASGAASDLVPSRQLVL
jgi:Glycosyl hydrolases family 39